MVCLSLSLIYIYHSHFFFSSYLSRCISYRNLLIYDHKYYYVQEHGHHIQHVFRVHVPSTVMSMSINMVRSVGTVRKIIFHVSLVSKHTIVRSMNFLREDVDIQIPQIESHKHRVRRVKRHMAREIAMKGTTNHQDHVQIIPRCFFAWHVKVITTVQVIHT